MKRSGKYTNYSMFDLSQYNSKFEDKLLKFHSYNAQRSSDVGIMHGVSCVFDRREQQPIIRSVGYRTFDGGRSVNGGIGEGEFVYTNQSFNIDTIKNSTLTPQRLDLDGLELKRCPLLWHNKELRYLSLERNLISCIDHHKMLPLSLIYLNLNGNHIEKIPESLSKSNLRVLLLGENRIFHIENIENLHLDVLDLQRNFITIMKNIPKNLRILNLSGNKIKKIENLQSHNNLTNLNLSKNCIENLNNCLPTGPSLKCLTLSNNQLRKYDYLQDISAIQNLSEICLDGNPFCFVIPPFVRDIILNSNFSTSLCTEHLYRAYCIYVLKTSKIKKIDTKLVSFREKESATILFSTLSKYVANKNQTEKNYLESKIVDLLECQEQDCKSIMEIKVISDINNDSTETEDVDQYRQTQKETESDSTENSSTSNSPSSMVLSGVTSSRKIIFSSFAEKNRSEHGQLHYNIEVPSNDLNRELGKGVSVHEGGGIILHIYKGCEGSWDNLFGTAPWIISATNHLVIHDGVSLNETCEIIGLTKDNLPNLTKVTLIMNSIETFEECIPIRIINESHCGNRTSFFSSHKLSIISPITSLVLFREFFAFLLPKLQELNGTLVSEQERLQGLNFFRTSFPCTQRQREMKPKRERLQPKRSLGFASSYRRNSSIGTLQLKTHKLSHFSKLHPYKILVNKARKAVQTFLDDAVLSITYNSLFDNIWTSLVHDTIRNTLNQMDNNKEKMNHFLLL